MKKIFFFISFVSLSLGAFAQKQDNAPVFPFKGGIEHMMNFFRDSVIVSQDIIQRKASGQVTIKFTSDPLGRVSRIVVCYADDVSLAQAAINGLKRSSGKWDIPVHFKSYDYLVTFSFNFSPPASPNTDLENSVYDFTINRKPLVTTNQLPLGSVTLLPTVMVNYEIPQ